MIVHAGERSLEREPSVDALEKPHVPVADVERVRIRRVDGDRLDDRRFQSRPMPEAVFRRLTVNLEPVSPSVVGSEEVRGGSEVQALRIVRIDRKALDEQTVFRDPPDVKVGVGLVVPADPGPVLSPVGRLVDAGVGCPGRVADVEDPGVDRVDHDRREITGEPLFVPDDLGQAVVDGDPVVSSVGTSVDASPPGSTSRPGPQRDVQRIGIERVDDEAHRQEMRQTGVFRFPGLGGISADRDAGAGSSPQHGGVGGIDLQ